MNVIHALWYTLVCSCTKFNLDQIGANHRFCNVVKCRMHPRHESFTHIHTTHQFFGWISYASYTRSMLLQWQSPWQQFPIQFRERQLAMQLWTLWNRLKHLLELEYTRRHKMWEYYLARCKQGWDWTSLQWGDRPCSIQSHHCKCTRLQDHLKLRWFVHVR